MAQSGVDKTLILTMFDGKSFNVIVTELCFPGSEPNRAAFKSMKSSDAEEGSQDEPVLANLGVANRQAAQCLVSWAHRGNNSIGGWAVGT